MPGPIADSLTLNDPAKPAAFLYEITTIDGAKHVVGSGLRYTGGVETRVPFQSHRQLREALRNGDNLLSNETGGLVLARTVVSVDRVIELKTKPAV